MKAAKRYKITIEDEKHLTEVASGHFSRAWLWLAGVIFLLLSIAMGGLLVSLTPMRTLLPGYLKDSQRSATEEGLLRLDSLMAAYETEKSFLDNYKRVMDTEREPGDSAAVAMTSRDLSPDSLSTGTNLEKKFVSQMEERERFNISVLAPLAAEGVMFSPITTDGIFTSATIDSEVPTIVLPTEENVQCTADGTVIALYHSPAEKGYVIIVHHNRGFVTAYNGLGTPMVGIGDNVNSGQILALAPSPDSKGIRKISVQMWHNGLALKPYEYLGNRSQRESAATESFESPRGR